jgi:hypothetical protein
MAPEEHGFHLLGLNSAYFKPNDDEDIYKFIRQASPEEMKFVQRMMQGDGPYLLFTHVPDLEDPYRAGSKADTGSSWKLPDDARATWKNILSDPNLAAVFSSHFHDSRRTIYPHNFTYAQNPPDAVTARKIWVAPPLAAKVQSHRPVEDTARGMLLVRVTIKGTQPVSPQDGTTVEATPIWFSPLDQKPPLPADDKLAAAHADESDGNWDKAATGYKALLDSDKTDSATRATALAGYLNAHHRMDSWWWKSPISRWFYVHGWALLYSAALLLAFTVVLAILRKLRLLRLVILTSKIIFMPKFKGQAVVNATTKMTPDAPADEFPAQLLAAAEGIRVCLAREQEGWSAKHISFLLPSSSSFNSLLGSIPKVKEVEISEWLKFMAGIFNIFRWTLETGVAVLQSDQASSAPPAKDEAPAMPEHGELTGYAVLQWGWFVRNSWHRKATLTGDRSAIRDLATQLADLVAGEAFH